MADDLDMLDLYEDLMIRENFGEVTLLKFDCGDHAWQELLRQDPDLLIIDEVLPSLDGRELLRLLNERKVRYPIIVTSGDAGFENKLRDCVGPNLNVTFLQKFESHPGAVKFLGIFVQTSLEGSK